MRRHALAKTCTLHAKAETAGTPIQSALCMGGVRSDCTLHAKAEVRERGLAYTLSRLNGVLDDFYLLRPFTLFQKKINFFDRNFCKTSQTIRALVYI